METNRTVLGTYREIDYLYETSKHLRIKNNYIELQSIFVVQFLVFNFYTNQLLINYDEFHFRRNILQT